MESNLKKVNTAHERRKLFVNFHEFSRLFEIKILYEIYNNKDWDKLGFESWRFYCEAPVESGGLHISQEWANQLINVYLKFVIELKLKEEQLLLYSPRKLYEIRNSVNKDNLDDMLSKVRNLTLQDLQLEKKNVDLMNCEHEWERWERCKKCKQWKKT